MNIKKFRIWLIENMFEDNKLFQESIKCYSVEAYKASFLYSYIGFIDYIKETIINYKGVPRAFEVKCKENKQDSMEKWKEILKKLDSEDKWEEETFNFIKEGKESNVFRLKDAIRNELFKKEI